MMAEAPRGKAVERSRLHHTRGPTDPLLRSTTPEPDKSLNIFAEEISSEVLEKLYTDTNTPILVNDPLTFECAPGLAFDEGDWHCLVVPLQLCLLQDLYKTHKTNLFSANVRDFLGVKAGDSNINYQMQRSLRDKPTNFFVYNNGLTILTHRIEQEVIADNLVKVSVHGISIVNGAQTTGKIGTSADRPPESAFVLARFISTQNEDLIAVTTHPCVISLPA